MSPEVFIAWEGEDARVAEIVAAAKLEDAYGLEASLCFARACELAAPQRVHRVCLVAACAALK